MSVLAGQIISITDPNSPISEAYRTLRTNIMLRDFDKSIKVINLVSANKQEGKSTTVINLALVYAQLDKKTLLIDMDLKLPSIHKKLRYKNSSGITDIISGLVEKEEATRRYCDNLDVIFAGSKITFSAEFVQSSALVNFIEACKKEYDIIIIDCPPIGLVPDGLIISSICDGTLLVCASNQTEKKELQKAEELLNEIKANVLGVVFTKVKLAKRYYSYSYAGGTTGPKKGKKKK